MADLAILAAAPRLRFANEEVLKEWATGADCHMFPAVDNCPFVGLAWMGNNM